MNKRIKRKQIKKMATTMLFYSWSQGVISGYEFEKGMIAFLEKKTVKEVRRLHRHTKNLYWLSRSMGLT